MIFADKLIKLRRKSGWSQEELAEQMNVSRQAVSKWEGAQSIPDLDKIIKLSELFGVSTDYLLKDEIEQADTFTSDFDSGGRTVTMEQASAFLKVKDYTSGKIALGVSLCIVSPICLFFLSVLCETKGTVSEGVAAGVGLCILFLLVAIAVALFIFCGSKTSEYEFLEKEIFETEYGVRGMVKQRKEEYKGRYMICNITGACLCILSVTLLFMGMIIDENNDLLLCGMVCLMILSVAIGAYLLIKAGIVWESFKKLLREGEYDRDKKVKTLLSSVVGMVYWLLATAVFLTYSLLTNDWGQSWIIMAVAGVLFPAVLAVVRLIESKTEKK